MNRIVVAHYHLFKNAGTSVDYILEHNFGEAFLTAEFDEQNTDENVAAVRRFIEENPAMRAFASHTAAIGRIDLPGTTVFPVVFVRHPLVRIRSAYLFERKQKADTFGARLAKETDLAGYVETRIRNSKDRSCSDFQTYRLSRYARAGRGDGRSELDCALEALAELDVVGVVERFDESMEAFAEAAGRRGIPLRPMTARRNTTEGNTAAPEAVEATMRAEIGDALFDELVGVNQGDYALHRAANAKLDALTPAEVVASAAGAGH